MDAAALDAATLDAATLESALETALDSVRDTVLETVMETTATLERLPRTAPGERVATWVSHAASPPVLGILSALLALELERTREVGVLRTIGFAPGQVRGLTLAQTGLLGLIAGLIASPLGVVLAALLVFVINERAFGWSMAFVVAPGVLAGGVLMAIVAALAAGIVPAIRMPRAPLASALREE